MTTAAEAASPRAAAVAVRARFGARQYPAGLRVALSPPAYSRSSAGPAHSRRPLVACARGDGLRGGAPGAPGLPMPEPTLPWGGRL